MATAATITHGRRGRRIAAAVALLLPLCLLGIGAPSGLVGAFFIVPPPPRVGRGGGGGVKPAVGRGWNVMDAPSSLSSSVASHSRAAARAGRGRRCVVRGGRASEGSTSSRENVIARRAPPVASAAAAAALAALIALVPVEIHIDHPSTTVGSFPIPPAVVVRRSAASALSEEQVLVSDVWKEVNRQYLDPTFNNLGEDKWRGLRLDAVKAVTNAGPDDAQVVYDVIRNMLKPLNDPYTRFLTPDQFESLTRYAKGGSSSGIGVQLSQDPKSGMVVVLNTAKDGPAAKGGVLPGDVVVEVDGTEMDGATAEVVAAKCRGEAGTRVDLAVRHGGNGAPAKTVTQISVTRAKVKVNPVEASTFVSDRGQKVGLLKVSSFSQETVAQVVDGLREVRAAGARSVVLDLRGNAGGYMPAGVDVAKLFLPPQARVVSEVDKGGRNTVYINDGVGSDTSLPLYLLVDRRTASASEILAAALQDNGRATVVSGGGGAGERTFGKGRIQNVVGPLQDGSGVAVTKAKYVTPNGRDIHGVGIAPDVASATCGPDDSAKVCMSGLV